MMNEHEVAARERKAHSLVGAIRAAGGRSEDLDLPEFPWDDAVAAAHVNPPSDKTKARVRELLVSLEDYELRHPDPFEGLV